MHGREEGIVEQRRKKRVEWAWFGRGGWKFRLRVRHGPGDLT